MLDPHFNQDIALVDSMTCRICFGTREEGLEEGNYFISPCDCSGT